MKSLKQIIIVGSCIFLTTVYAAERSENDLAKYLKSKKDVPSKFTEAWELAQSSDEKVLELAAKIKKIQSCTDCLTSEKEFFINLLLNPTESDFRGMVPEDLVKEYNLYLVCLTGYCPKQDKKSVLHRILNSAIKKNRKELVGLLIDAGVRTTGFLGTNSSPLINAVKLGHKDIVQLLLDKGGGDINFKGWNGDTALVIAVAEGNKELVQMLLDKGAYLNADNGAKYPLIEAVKIGNKEIVKMLLDKGADVLVQDFDVEQGKHSYQSRTRYFYEYRPNGNTALKIAEEKGDAELVEMLKKAGAQ